MSHLITLTSASGKQCAHIIPHLYGDPKYKLRLVANRPESVEKLKTTYENAEVIQADLCQPNDCARIVAGASTVLHIGPSFHPHETAIGCNMVDAVLTLPKGSCHFVYSSVLHTQLRKLMNHDSKRYVEEYLIESQLPWTILSPTKFMEQFPISLMVQQHRDGKAPVYEAVSNPNLPQSSVALVDLGEAFVKVVAERDTHSFAKYQLCSTLPTSIAVVVKLCGQQLGTNIQVKKLSRDQADEKLLTTLFGDVSKAPLASREQASRMLLHYEDRGLQGSPNVLRWLLGREPTGYAEWLADSIAKAQG